MWSRGRGVEAGGRVVQNAVQPKPISFDNTSIRVVVGMEVFYTVRSRGAGESRCAEVFGANAVQL